MPVLRAHSWFLLVHYDSTQHLLLIFVETKKSKTLSQYITHDHLTLFQHDLLFPLRCDLCVHHGRPPTVSTIRRCGTLKLDYNRTLWYSVFESDIKDEAWDCWLSSNVRHGEH